MEQYQLLHNKIYWGGMFGTFIIGLFNSETYLTEVMGPIGGEVTSLTELFNGMVYDSTFLLIIISTLLAFVLGQEFQNRTINSEIFAGYNRRDIFISKVCSYVISFNIMAILYPISGCIREYMRYGIENVGLFFYNITRTIIYCFFLHSTVFLIPVYFCCLFRNTAKAVSVTAIVTFVISLYLGYGMLLKLPVSFLPIYQIREVVTSTKIFMSGSFIVGIIWWFILIISSRCLFLNCDLK